MEMKLPDDFKEFLRLLSDHQVKYLLIGGFAVGYHGYPRATNDIDIWINISEENADRIHVALKEFGFDLPQLSPALFLDPDKIVKMGAPPMRIEILTGISGVDFEECYQERVEDTINGVRVKIISLSRLKENKLASGRHKDLDDLEKLP